MKLKIVQAGDPVLRKQSRQLTKAGDPQPANTATNRTHAKHDARGAGRGTRGAADWRVDSNGGN